MVFSKKKAAKAPSATVVKPEPPSIVSADLHVIGDLEGDGEMHIEGRVDGNIRCESLTVGERGQIEGKIVVNTLRLHGTITGSVRARSVSMMRTARMIGDVAHEKIEIEAGAMVDGLYKHLKAEDFEKRGERFKDVTPPELPKAAISRGAKTEETGGKPAAKPGGKKETPAKALH